MFYCFSNLFSNNCIKAWYTLEEQELNDTEINAVNSIKERGIVTVSRLL